jgi:phospholipase C
VLWIFMENKPYKAIVGSPRAPAINRVARQCGLATQYTAITHPSLPNYIAATSGNTWKISDDAGPPSHRLRVPSIYSQLQAAGKTWRDYEESAPSACPSRSHGLYATKHDPAPYYTPIAAACVRWDVPLSTLARDLALNTLPDFAFVTPNLCNDMHDCPVKRGDVWLSAWLGRILTSQPYRAGTTAVFVVWDEPGIIPNIVLSPSTLPGTTSDTPVDHYSLLRTTEEMLGLRNYLGRAASARSMRTAFRL